ncbi:hypothetical protein [Falsiroseomonas tokyonensis]|uniref:Uncharacterized protein n=1 Tax=Falsiroseomonas tokyonensis TaxID=430521 RepID=A0ABV7C254_9PROT|nr:hypothetical protein [Falsiroseomonas tokyonensis]MBU8540196.1 hypothetical protein [Falsiroseomonas tokyonensis]
MRVLDRSLVREARTGGEDEPPPCGVALVGAALVPLAGAEIAPAGTIQALRDCFSALVNIRDYLQRHADKLPPMSTATIEVRIEQAEALLALAGEA